MQRFKLYGPDSKITLFTQFDNSDRLFMGCFGKGISGAINDLPMVGGLNQILGAVLNVAVTAALVFAILLAWQRFFPAAYGDVMKGAPLARFAGEHNLLTQLFR